MAVTQFEGPVKSGTVWNAGAGTAATQQVNSGLVTMEQVATIQANSTTPIDATIYLPKSSKIIEIIWDTTVAWTAVTSATGSAGTASGGTTYASGVDLKTAGRTRAHTTAQLASMTNIGTTNVAVVLTATSVGGSTSTGTTVITIVYAQTA